MDSTKEKNNTLSIWVILLFIGLLILGLIGFRYIAELSWIDAFQNTAFYMSGLGPVAVMKTTEQKLFSGIYALIATVLYLGIIVYIIDQIFGLAIFKSS